MPRYILHVDLDQFIAAVELLRRPELRGRPVVIGGDGDPTKRGVVSTASYEARRFGIESGMALRTAYRRCPEAVFLPVDADAYRGASREVMATLRSFPSILEVAGWDEAFLDTDTPDPEAVAREVQRTVRDRTGLECSVGIGDNKLRAKIASGFAKPAGVYRLTGENWAEVMERRPPEALWGIGRKRARRLAGMGLPTVAALARADPEALARAFGPATGPWLVRLARGESDSPVTAEPHRARSRGRETTFQENLEDLGRIRGEVRRLAREVADDLREEGRPAVRVVVKVRFAPFITRTRGVPVDPPAAGPEALERAALDALGRFDLDRPVRLLGVRADLAATRYASVERPKEAAMVSGYVLVSVEPGKNEEVLAALREIKGVKQAHACWGQPDIFAFVEVADAKALSDTVLQAVQGIAGIRTTETHIVISV